MVEIYLVQHAKAKSKEEDPERRITEEGRAETEKVAKFVKDKIKVAKIFHSTKTRARQTAEILKEYLQPSEFKEEKDLEPLADPKKWAEKLKEARENTMIVGHLPHLSRLASLLLIGDQEQEIVKFRYSGIVCLEGENGKFKVKFYITPDLL